MKNVTLFPVLAIIAVFGFEQTSLAQSPFPTPTATFTAQAYPGPNGVPRIAETVVSIPPVSPTSVIPPADSVATATRYPTITPYKIATPVPSSTPPKSATMKSTRTELPKASPTTSSYPAPDIPHPDPFTRLIEMIAGWFK